MDFEKVRIILLRKRGTNMGFPERNVKTTLKF